MINELLLTIFLITWLGDYVMGDTFRFFFKDLVFKWYKRIKLWWNIIKEWLKKKSISE